MSAEKNCFGFLLAVLGIIFVVNDIGWDIALVHEYYADSVIYKTFYVALDYYQRKKLLNKYNISEDCGPCRLIDHDCGKPILTLLDLEPPVVPFGRIFNEYWGPGDPRGTHVPRRSQAPPEEGSYINFRFLL